MNGKRNLFWVVTSTANHHIMIMKLWIYIKIYFVLNVKNSMFILNAKKNNAYIKIITHNWTMIKANNILIKTAVNWSIVCFECKALNKTKLIAKQINDNKNVNFVTQSFSQLKY